MWSQAVLVVAIGVSLVLPGSLKAPCPQTAGENRTVVDNLMKNVGLAAALSPGPCAGLVCVPLQPFDAVH